MGLVAVCEAALLATALSAWLPFVSWVVSSAIVKGALLIAAPEFAPSTWNCTRVVFDDALAVTDTLPDTVAPESGDVMDTVGAGGGGGAVLDPEPLRPLQPDDARASNARNQIAPAECRWSGFNGFNRSLLNFNVTLAGEIARPFFFGPPRPGTLTRREASVTD